jgi:hypothetical protein
MRIRTTLVMTLLLFCGVAAAHHGWSGYDESKTLTLAGTVERSSWGNPHGTLRLRTKNASWKVILAPVARMKSRGIKPEMIAKGAAVTVVGYRHTEHRSELRAERIVIGKSTFELR